MNKGNISQAKNKISQNIKNYRQSMKMTQSELAEKFECQKSLISNYENGYAVPDIYVLIKLADIFDVTLDELVGR